MTTQANPYVSGKRVILQDNMKRPTVLGTFSCHNAACDAVVRLRQPSYKAPDGDKPEDLKEEERMRDRLRLVKAGSKLPPVVSKRMSDHSHTVEWRFAVPPLDYARVVISQRKDGPFRSNGIGGPGHYYVSVEEYKGDERWEHVPGSSTGAYSSFELARGAAERVWADRTNPDPLDDAIVDNGGRTTL